MATTSFAQNFSVSKERATEFVSVMTKPPAYKLSQNFQTQMMTKAEVKKYFGKNKNK